MKVSPLLLLPSSLLPTIFALSPSTNPSTLSYHESLHLTPLPPGSLYAGFTFLSTTPLSAYQHNHFRYFPRALAQILQYTHTSELHLRFGLGRWDDEGWGRRPREGRREGGNGVEVWAWIDNNHDGVGEDVGEDEDGAMGRWSDLVNSLSGLFCASLNFVDEGKTTRPVLSFSPEGTPQRNGSAELLHGTLPHEVVCTENLTPFLKLLPCKGKAGISSLLDGHKVFDAEWQGMSVDVRRLCPSSTNTPMNEVGEECLLEIEQSVDMVLDLGRSMRERGNPIPRPPPIEEMVCDERKEYNGHDTCYPRVEEGEREWSLSRVFGRPIRGSCPLGQHDKEGEGIGDFDIRLDGPDSRIVDIVSEAPVVQSKGPAGERLYRLPEGVDFDLQLPKQILTTQDQGELSANLFIHTPPLYATRHITGSGASSGGMHATLTNPHPYPQKIIYLESLPWFLRPYMHTLKVNGGGKIEKMYYTPALDRKRPTHLELEILVPAEGKVDLTYEFEKAGLRYTEYPPDANRGFDIPAAIIRVLPPSINNTQPHSPSVSGDQSYYLRTPPLLLTLPTPDFSMPYNVIILTSTVIALGFGSVFNLLVRRFVLAEEVPKGRLDGIIGKAKALVGRIRGQEATDQNKLVGAIGDGEVANGTVGGEGGKKER